MYDPELLPAKLAAKSLSDREIVLAHDDVIEAIDHLVAIGCFIGTWEGWLKYPDGKHGHSGQHQGTMVFRGTEGQSAQKRVKEAALFAQRTIEEAQQQENANPEVVGAILYFCLYIEVA